MRRALSHLSVCLTCAVVAVLPSTGAGATTLRPDHDEPARRLAPPGASRARIHDGQLQVDRERWRLADVLREPRNTLDPAKLSTTVRDLLRQEWNVNVPDPRAAEVEADFVIGLPVGDLDGDGRADVASYEYTVQSDTVGVRMLRGTDGSELWTAASDVYDAFPLQMGDVNGDGVDDVLVFSITVGEPIFGTCALVACTFEGETVNDWTFRMVSGDGTELWSRNRQMHVDVSYLFGSALVAGAAVYQLEVENTFLFPMQAGSGVVINELDLRAAIEDVYAFGPFVVVFAEAYDIEYATRAEFVSASTEQPIVSRNQDSIDGVSYMYGIGDAIGDSATDVAWETVIWGEGLFACAAVVIGTCTDSGTYSQTIDAIDGSTAATAWTLQPEVSDIWLYPLGADVSGDGKDDLFSLDWASYTQGVRSGADGTPLWSKDLSDWVVLPPLGSVGGEVGSDFLEIGYEYLGSGLSLSLNRLDGATGATLFSSTYEPELPEESDSYAYAFLGGDLDGDGVLDPVIDMYVYDYVTGGETRSIGHAESGRDATILFARDVTGYVSTWPADGYDGGDLDGDGTDDLLELSLNDSTLTVGAHLMPDAGPAWTWTESYDDNQWLNWLYLFGTADTSGDGGDDLLLYREVYTETDDGYPFAGRFDVVEGSTGGVRWGKGRALS